MLDDAQQQGHPFLMLGVFEHALAQLEMAMPGYFFAKADRNYSEYIYSRDKLSTLSGKKLQPKRNFINRFVAQHPDYQFVPLTPDLFDRCLELDHKWAAEKAEEETHDKFTYEAERQALVTMFDNWEATGARGGALIVDNEIIAFTLGAGINYDTFDVLHRKGRHAIRGRIHHYQPRLCAQSARAVCVHQPRGRPRTARLEALKTVVSPRTAAP